ncbi:MAG: helix-turn-helix transcriptional regulator [Pseudarcicella sp.]|nr:helix-turn-helix transcriptional regulator [Pseudarcicella sp.]
MNSNKNLGDKIRVLRKMIDLNQDNLAEVLNVSQQTYSRMKNTSKINGEQLDIIAKVLGVK